MKTDESERIDEAHRLHSRERCTDGVKTIARNFTRPSFRSSADRS